MYCTLPIFSLIFFLSFSTAEINQQGIPNDTKWALLAWGFPNGGHDSTSGVQLVDLDIDEQKDQISGFKSAGQIVMCYFSAGTLEPFRPDCQANKNLWLSAAVGEMAGWGEYWLNITNLPLLQELMTPRFTKAVSYGCDVIEPDNTDCFDNSDCYSAFGHKDGTPLIPYQIAFNNWLAQIAHSKGLKIALKNTLGLIDQIGDNFDCAVNEQCQTYQECDGYSNYVAANKAVFQVEYKAKSAFCTGAKKYHLQTKYCPTGTDDGICAAGSSWTDCNP